MLYPLIKAVHIVAVIVWIGGMLQMGFVQAAVPADRARHDEWDLRFVRSAYRWNRRVTSPAIVLAWLMGLLLAWLGGWASAPWFMAKFVVAFLLAVLHGIQSGALRLAATDSGAVAPALLRHATGVILVAVAAVVVLVVTKPF